MYKIMKNQRKPYYSKFNHNDEIVEDNNKCKNQLSKNYSNNDVFVQYINYRLYLEHLSIINSKFTKYEGKFFVYIYENIS